MAATTTAQFLISEVIDFRKSQPKNPREIIPCAMTEVSAQQTARRKREKACRAILYQALRQATLSICNNSRSRICSVHEEIVASLHLDLRSLKLEYKTTCDALRNWPGGPAEEQEFLEYKKQELFRALVEHTFHDEPV